MIFASLSQTGVYLGLDPRLEACFRFLRGLSPDFPEGVYKLRDLEENAGSARVQTCRTAPPEERRFEAHRRHLDIHCVLAGEETARVSPLSWLSETGGYDEASDIAFYEGPPCQELVLRPGHFALYGPDDGHMPALARGRPGSVKKVVLKLPLPRW